MKRVICTICCLILLGGCSQFVDNQVIKPTIKINTSSREFRHMLAIMCKARFKTEPWQDVNWIRADLDLAAYYAGID